MRVLVLGGDGFCGWPVVLRLSAAGHDVAVADTFARRGADHEQGIESLTPIGSLNDRVAAWRETGGAAVGVHVLDAAADPDALRDLLTTWRPAAVVHLAQQRAAAYAMRTATHKRYTMDNNVSATHNLLVELVECGLDAHVVAVGGLQAPCPNSVQALSQAMGRQALDFFARNDGLRITDLRQGIVWGTQTPETLRDERLLNRFDYDGDHGTVVNRFCVQAALGLPLEVHGDGDAACAVLHLEDAVAAVERALADSPERGAGVRVVERATETHRVGDLAARVAALTGAEVTAVPDPRRGDPAGTGEPGPDPVRLSDERLLELVALAGRYRDRADRRRIPYTSRWVRDDAGAVAPAAA